MADRALASRLRHPIEIRRGAQEKNEKGGFATNWTSLAKPFAEVIGLDGRESVMDQVLQGISVYRITIRWRAGIQQSDQIRSESDVFQGKELNVRSAVDPTGRREELVIIADTASTQVS